jgi:hypothetical protein
VLDAVGGFRADLGRNGGRLILGQEVPELLARVAASGGCGLYVPGMSVHHLVPAERLTRRYFRRWWYGKGVSRARLDRLRPLTETGLDLRTVPRLAGIPRFAYGSAVRDAVGFVRAAIRKSPTERARCEMMLTYFFGYAAASVLQHMRSRRSPPCDAAAVADS